jgi:hypothetical protein
MTRDEVVKKRVEEAGQLYRTIMLRAYNGDCSPREAIKAQCLICVGYERQSITDCTGYSCALWQFRPYQRGEE